jgi:N6-L-threonylcarbamoyladenine synthase
MIILGIESSCDETSASLVENGNKILSNTVASSQKLHAKTGGIIPEIAAREQVKCIIPVIEETLKQGRISNWMEIDALAVTVGPGLIGSLLIGVETAKTIAFVKAKPLIPVNHIFAHFYANWLTGNNPLFPAIALVVSGGHTELFLMKGHENLRWLGGTKDDAAGETFDKTARMLDLGYPGGPAISYAASNILNGNRFSSIHLPRPMIGKNNLDFSFSGLKTAVLRKIEHLKIQEGYFKETINILAYEIQEAITDVLVKKTIKAAFQNNVKSIILGGGVAANTRLKEKFEETLGGNSEKYSKQNGNIRSLSLHIPPPILCTDNASYIASYAYYNNHPIPWQNVQAVPGLEVEI